MELTRMDILNFLAEGNHSGVFLLVLIIMVCSIVAIVEAICNKN